MVYSINAIKVALGNFHMLILAAVFEGAGDQHLSVVRREVFSCGVGSEGQLGFGTSIPFIERPSCVASLSGRDITDIFARNDISTAITSTIERFSLFNQ